MEPKTLGELAKAIEAILPHASIERDNDGQLIVYTGVIQSRYSDDLEPYEAE